jgi:hypothetical protein
MVFGQKNGPARWWAAGPNSREGGLETQGVQEVGRIGPSSKRETHHKMPRAPKRKLGAHSPRSKRPMKNLFEKCRKYLPDPRTWEVLTRLPDLYRFVHAHVHHVHAWHFVWVCAAN